MTASAFMVYVQRGIDAAGTQRALAKRLGVGEDRISRVIKGDGLLGTLACLRLAELLDESPVVVLQAADKPDLADAVDRLLGAAGGGTVSARERAMLETWRALTAADRAAVQAIIGRLISRRPTDAPAPASKTKTRK